MRLWLIPALAVMLLLAGCGGDDEKNSGTITLTSELYDAGSYYYGLGLSFEEAEAVPTLPDQYRADIIVNAGPVTTGGPVVAYLTVNTLKPPFALIGAYGSESEARSAFDGLKNVGIVTYIDLATPLAANQIWVVKARDDRYAKLRIIDVSLTLTPESRATCTFEWVYQPDGSATFP